MNTEITLGTIETSARIFHDAHKALSNEVQEMNDAITAIKRAKMAVLKRLVIRAKETRAALEQQIEAAPDLFTKPRTLILSGITCGFRKQKGKTICEDPDRTVALIKKHFDKSEHTTLINTTEKPDLKAIGKLTAEQIKKLGIEITRDTDKTVTDPADSEVDKIVEALLAESTEQEVEIKQAA